MLNLQKRNISLSGACTCTLQAGGSNCKKWKVITQQKHFVNDAGRITKPIATDK
jgi:hypothetical protein